MILSNEKSSLFFFCSPFSSAPPCVYRNECALYAVVTLYSMTPYASTGIHVHTSMLKKCIHVTVCTCTCSMVLSVCSLHDVSKVYKAKVSEMWHATICHVSKCSGGRTLAILHTHTHTWTLIKSHVDINFTHSHTHKKKSSCIIIHVCTYYLTQMYTYSFTRVHTHTHTVYSVLTHSKHTHTHNWLSTRTMYIMHNHGQCTEHWGWWV